MNIDDLTIKQARELAALFAPSVPVATTAHPHAVLVGRVCVIRSHLSGVWLGEVVAVHGASGVTLKGARRAWSWSGAGSCSGLAVKGPSGGQIAPPVEVSVVETIEAIPASPVAIAAWSKVPEWLG